MENLSEQTKREIEEGQKHLKMNQENVAAAMMARIQEELIAPKGDPEAAKAAAEAKPLIKSKKA